MDSVFDVHQEAYDGSSTGDTLSELTRIWASVLDIEQVDPDENFFLLGGDSLRAATLFAEVDAAFGIMLPLDTIYDEGETVTGMAELIDSLTAPRGAKPNSEAAPAMENPDNSGVPVHRDESEPVSCLVSSDLTTVLTLLSLATICWLPAVPVRSAICRQLARAHIALRGSQADYLNDVVPLLEGYSSAADLERDMLAGGYQEMAAVLRDYLPQKTPPKARFKGREHIETALEAGRGAVLWNMPGAPGGRAALRCLADAGFPIAQLRSAAHPYSGSRFGRKFLNPISNYIDEQYLELSAVLHDDNAIETMQCLGDALTRNMVARISANGSSGSPYELPFLGGTLKLALGAPTLALLHGAPLIPSFCIPDGKGGFDYIAEAPLVDHTDRPIGKRAEALAHQYADVLSRHVMQHPQLWRCWYMNNTWRAGE